MIEKQLWLDCLLDDKEKESVNGRNVVPYLLNQIRVTAVKTAMMAVSKRVTKTPPTAAPVTTPLPELPSGSLPDFIPFSISPFPIYYPPQPTINIVVLINSPGIVRLTVSHATLSLKKCSDVPTMDMLYTSPLPRPVSV